MPLQCWEIAVHGNAHHVTIDRNADSGKFLVRVDGRVAIKPFAETRCEQPIEIDGRPFLLLVDNGRYSLTEKTSRYVDSSKPRESSDLGAVTIARGLEHITIVTDQAILRVEKLSEILKNAAGSAAGGGILGTVVTEAAAAVAQKFANEVGAPFTVKQQLRSFAQLDRESFCRFEHLPFELIVLLDEIDLSSRVLIVPRRAITSIELSNRKLIATSAAGAQKFDITAAAALVLDHLCAASYPLSDEDLARATDAAREERGRRTADVPEAAVRSVAKPAAIPADLPRNSTNFTGLPEIRWTSPVLSVLGRDPKLEAMFNEDAPVWTSVYPKSLRRCARFDETLRDLATTRCDIFYLHAVFDEKTRFRDAGGFVISLKDLIVKLLDHRVRMLWLASPNDPTIAKPALDWAAVQNFFLAFTTERSGDYPGLLSAALAALAAGEPLSKSWLRIAEGSRSRCLFTGRGEAIFHPK